METVQYKCPNCGAALEYKAGIQKFGCDYCMSEFTEEEVKEIFRRNESVDIAESPEVQQQISEFTGHTNLYSCPSCGAEIISDSNTAATFCTYCHNPVTLTGRVSGEYRPSKVIPFKIEKEKSEELFKDWVRRKFFIPKQFKTEQQREKLVGLYVPFWLADCDLNAHVNAIGKHTRSWTSGNYRYTETREYAVERQAEIFFSGVPADGAEKIDDKFMQALEPFDYNDMKDFSMSYFSGFYADKYDVDKAQVFPIIRARITDGAQEIIRSSISGYSSVSIVTENFNVMNTNWQYAMLPVWFMTMNFKDKRYYFAVNGQTGKVAGIPPLSWGKLVGVFAGLSALAVILIILGGYLLWL